MIETDFSIKLVFGVTLPFVPLRNLLSTLPRFVRNRTSSMDNRELSEVDRLIDQIGRRKSYLMNFQNPNHNLMHPFDDIDWNMDNAPIQPAEQEIRIRVVRVGWTIGKFGTLANDFGNDAYRFRLRN